MILKFFLKYGKMFHWNKWKNDRTRFFRKILFTGCCSNPKRVFLIYRFLIWLVFPLVEFILYYYCTVIFIKKFCFKVYVTVNKWNGPVIFFLNKLNFFLFVLEGRGLSILISLSLSLDVVSGHRQTLATEKPLKLRKMLFISP